MIMTQPRTIAVLGGGYAGLFAAQRAVRAARGVSRARGPAVRVVLIDANDAWQDPACGPGDDGQVSVHVRTGGR
jgi:flavin-dependent dehydrogenase